VGQIIALAGDFYGLSYKGAFYKPYTPIQSIADKDIKLSDLYKPITKNEKKRFMSAFNSLYKDTLAKVEVPKLIKIINKVESMIKRKKKYDPTCDYEYATGAKICSFGIPSPSDDFNGRYLKLAENNLDHFGIHAIRTYIIGHMLALECAKETEISRLSSEKGQRQFSRCLALEGYAQHFLTDIHSGGHIRTPRVELMDSIQPYSATIAGLLAKTMHDEDSTFGVEVDNHSQDSWKAYGDDYLLNDQILPKEDKDQLSIIIRTSQSLIDEVIDSLLYKRSYIIEQYAGLQLIPLLDDIRISNAQMIDKATNSPLFITDSSRSKVLRRTNMGDRKDFSWIENWTVVGTIGKAVYCTH